MKQEDIIRMAREVELQTDSAGVWVDDGYITNQLERFAALVAAAEREACAKLAEMAEPYQTADLIRARGQA